jgi:CDP-glucose 4,6-dehydratase
MEDPRVLGQAFNLSPQQAISVLDVVARIQQLMGCEHLRPEVHNTAQGEIHSQYLDSSKAMRLLGWRPCFSLDEGLLETIAWYRDYLTQRKDTGSARVSATSGEQGWPGN